TDGQWPPGRRGETRPLLVLRAVSDCNQSRQRFVVRSRPQFGRPEVFAGRGPALRRGLSLYRLRNGPGPQEFPQLPRPLGELSSRSRFLSGLVGIVLEGSGDA